MCTHARVNFRKKHGLPADASDATASAGMNLDRDTATTVDPEVKKAFHKFAGQVTKADKGAMGLPTVGAWAWEKVESREGGKTLGLHVLCQDTVRFGFETIPKSYETLPQNEQRTAGVNPVHVRANLIFDLLWKIATTDLQNKIKTKKFDLLYALQHGDTVVQFKDSKHEECSLALAYDLKEIIEKAGTSSGSSPTGGGGSSSTDSYGANSTELASSLNWNIKDFAIQPRGKKKDKEKPTLGFSKVADEYRETNAAARRARDAKDAQAAAKEEKDAQKPEKEKTADEKMAEKAAKEDQKKVAEEKQKNDAKVRHEMMTGYMQNEMKLRGVTMAYSAEVAEHAENAYKFPALKVVKKDDEKELMVVASRDIPAAENLMVPFPTKPAAQRTSANYCIYSKQDPPAYLLEEKHVFYEEKPVAWYMKTKAGTEPQFEVVYKTYEILVKVIPGALQNPRGQNNVHVLGARTDVHT